MAELVFVFLLGLITSFLANISGGGGALILLPALIKLGISPLDSIGTVKLGAMGLIIGSAFSTKAKGIVRKDYLLKLCVIVGLASFIGPLIAFSLSEQQVKMISSLFIIITAIASIVSWQAASKPRDVPVWSRYLGFLLYFLATTILAGFGSGVGLLSNYIIIGLLGMTALQTIATRRITGFVGTPIQLILFVQHGSINFAAGALLLAGSLVGGYVGMNFAIQKGNNFVKKAMAAVAIILVITLFF